MVSRDRCVCPRRSPCTRRVRSAPPPTSATSSRRRHDAGFTGTTLAKATFGDLDIKAHTIPADVWKAEIKTKGESDLYVQQNTWDPGLCAGASRAPAGTRIPARAS